MSEGVLNDVLFKLDEGISLKRYGDCYACVRRRFATKNHDRERARARAHAIRTRTHAPRTRAQTGV